MKLITTNDYLLLIDEEAEIKEGGELSFYKNNHGSEILCISYLSKTGVVFHELDVDPVEEYGSIEGGLTPLKENISKIIAYYPLKKEAKELDLPLLPNPFEEDTDVEKLACIKYNVKDGIRDYDERYYNTINVAKAEAFIEGYKAAQSKQFSLEDVKKAIDMAREMDCTNYDYYGYCDKTYTEEEIIQALSTQQLPVSFEPEYEEVVSSKWGYGASCDYKLKTIINSEGKEEIQGTYIFELKN